MLRGDWCRANSGSRARSQRHPFPLPPLRPAPPPLMPRAPSAELRNAFLVPWARIEGRTEVEIEMSSSAQLYQVTPRSDTQAGALFEVAIDNLLLTVRVPDGWVDGQPLLLRPPPAKDSRKTKPSGSKPPATPPAPLRPAPPPPSTTAAPLQPSASPWRPRVLP